MFVLFSIYLENKQNFSSSEMIASHKVCENRVDGLDLSFNCARFQKRCDKFFEEKVTGIFL